MTRIVPPPPAEKSPWEILSHVDVSARIEKKNGLSYLSWAWAWGELKNHYPHAWFRKHEGNGGFPCFHDVQGYAFVKVTVGLDRTGDTEVTEMLPVLDHRNKPIQGPNAFEVNNALQRCLAKAIAYLGLGHYIYAGEDLPTETVDSAPAAPPTNRAAQGQASQPAPPAPPFSTPNAVTVFDALGGPLTQDASEDVIMATFLAFIPICTDEKTLTQFYAMNRGARDYLLMKDAAKHATVLAAFSDAKKKLAGAVGASAETKDQP